MMTHDSIARFAAAAAVLSACGAAHAAEIIVPTQMSLTTALQVALDGDTITLLPSGSPYVTTTGYAYTGKRLTIRGSTGNPADVVLDGGGQAIVLTISGADVEGSVVRGLTIRNGRGLTGANATGAGLFVHTNSAYWVRVENCIIRDNVVPAVDGNGAGLAVLNANVELFGTRLENNSTGSAGSTGDGAGLYINGSDAWVLGCEFVGNTAGEVAGGWGGAAFVDQGFVQFAGCTFTGNSAASGGAVLIGGTSGTVTFQACRFTGNNAVFNGGAVFSGGAGSLRNCLIADNTAGDNGAALAFNSSAAAEFTVDSCTIAGNTGPTSIQSPAAGAPLILSNTIIWNNSGTAGHHLYRYCLLQGGAAAANGSFGNLSGSDPLFVSAGSGDYRLQAASPAIDRGDTSLHVGIPVDLDGKPRAVEIPARPNAGWTPFGPIVDIGAYEFQVPAACYANCDSSTTAPVLNVADFTCFLQRFAAGCN